MEVFKKLKSMCDKHLDWLLHAFVSYSIVLTLGIFNLIAGVCVASILGLMKEGLDGAVDGGWDWDDIIADLIGIIIGLVMGVLFL